MQSITVQSVLSPKPHILPTIATCNLSLAGPRFVLVTKPTGSMSSTSALLGKVLPYLSSLVTIASPTCSMRSSRYISLVIPKPNTSFARLSLQFYAANDWNKLQKFLKLETYISLTNSISCQSSLPITAPVHSPSVNSPPNYLIPKLFFIFLFCTPLSLLAHHHLHIYHSSV